MVQDTTTTRSLVKYVCLIMDYCGDSLKNVVDNEYQTYQTGGKRSEWLLDFVGIVVHDVAYGLKVSRFKGGVLL